MKRYLLVVLPLAAWLAGCSQPPQERKSGSGPAPVAVNTAAAEVRQWPAMYEATGTVAARSVATISAKWLGYVREVKVQTGDRVAQGQLLVVLDARDLDASSNHAAAAREEIRASIPEADSAIAAAQSNLELAQVTFRRMNELYGKRSISDQEFDEVSSRQKDAQAAYDMARAKRKQLDARLEQAEQDTRAAEVSRSYAQIQAPFAGIVTQKMVEPGNLATPGTPLLTIEGDAYRLEAAVEESKLSAIRAGQAVSVTLDGRDAPIAARVSEILPAVDAASRAATVRIDLPPLSGLHAGVFGRAAFPLGNRAVTAIPAASVVERGQLQSVFVNEGGVARARLVTLGDRFRDQVEVLSGITAGEQVIVPAPAGLADGAAVEVKP